MTYRRANHRADVGPEARFDILGAAQFALLYHLGLREYHKVLDVGCGSLRAGRLLIAYLDAGHYVGLEPREEVVQDGIDYETSRGLVDLKQARFVHNENFDLSAAGEAFDVVLLHSIFSHAARWQIASCLASAKQVLTESGFLAATFVSGSTDYHGQSWLWDRTCEYKPSTMIHMAKRQGYDFYWLEWPHHNQRWFLLKHSGVKPRLPKYCRIPGLVTLPE